MVSMDSSLANLVRQGVITKHLALERASSPGELKRLLEGAPAGSLTERKAA
jgi:Tfp pilus assembly pilus retraction ATPase PilT